MMWRIGFVRGSLHEPCVVVHVDLTLDWSRRGMLSWTVWLCCAFWEGNKFDNGTCEDGEVYAVMCCSEDSLCRG